MDRHSQNGKKNVIIPYHLLRKSPLDVLVNRFIIWISDKEASRIIQSHHVTYTNESCFLLTACRNTDAYYCITFLTVWNSWLRQQISKIPSLYKVSLSFRWNDEGKKAVKTTAECFMSWWLCLFSSSFLSNMYYWLERKVNMTGYMAKFLFLIGYATRLRSLGRYATSCFEFRLRLIFKLMRGRLEASLAFCLPRRSRGKWKKDDANIQSSWPAWSIKDLVTVLSSYRGFCSQRPVFILLLFSILRVGRQPMQDTDLSRFFKAKRYHGSLRDTIAHLLQTHLRRLGTRRII